MTTIRSSPGISRYGGGETVPAEMLLRVGQDALPLLSEYLTYKDFTDDDNNNNNRLVTFVAKKTKKMKENEKNTRIFSNRVRIVNRADVTAV